ncbi:MAG: alpha/beta fold hydrolase [Paracoccaceae bacterium]|jgi:predicted dienelactone hydrolase|nr:alpha/beta fold hydrolase [Paracoccaceae bacterium]
MKHIFLTTTMIAAEASTPLAAQNRIDGQAPDAPTLSAYGAFDVGVRTLDGLPGDTRDLTLELWYPALAGSTGDMGIDALIRDAGVVPSDPATPGFRPDETVRLQGRAIRDAAPIDSAEDFPLVILSHGFPGNRYLMSHLGENLASKGYVVASIDHSESLYSDDPRPFGSTLLNRPYDQLFVLEEMARLNADPTSDLAGRIDTDNTGLVGYSMGGYGAIITAGGGLSPNAPFGPDVHESGSPTHDALPDPRIKTVIAIGPWGRQFGLWDEAGLSEIDIPMMFIAGSNDTISGYDTGVRKIWEETTGTDRALLTFIGGSHNTAAPIPAPLESFYFNDELGFDVSEHYTDPVWDTVFMNNVAQHFSTAWFDTQLKGDASRSIFLDLPENGDLGGWEGFTGDASAGLRYETLSATPAPVPLPASLWMLGLAATGLGVLARRRATTA